MLHRIKIERFKNIVSFDETLTAVTVLVGTNNSGKTSILNAIHTAVAFAQSRARLPELQRVPDANGAVTINIADLLYLPSVDVNWLARYGEPIVNNGPKVVFFLTGAYVGEGNVEIIKAEGRNLSVKLDGDAVIARIEMIDRPFSIYVPGLAGIARTEELMSRGNLLRAVARGDANLVLRNVLYLLSEENSKWVRFEHELQEVYPNHAIVVSFDKDADEFITVFVENGGRRIPLDCIGTGFLQVVQILSYIFLFEPEVTLLDEPDSHLHPNNQRILASLLVKLAAAGRTRILMATHSRHMVDALRGKEEVAMKWMRNGSVVTPTNHIALLMDLGALDKAEGLLSGKVDFVLLTEDQNTDLLTLLCEANGAQKGSFQVWSYKGCAKTDVAEAIVNFIKEVSPSTEVLVHRDSDFLNSDDQEFLRDQFKDYKVEIFFPPTPDPEGLLCRVEHLKFLNPGFEPQVQDAHNRAIASKDAEMRSAAEEGRLLADDFRHKHKRAAEGERAIQLWSRALDLTDERWRHGKMFRRAIRTEFQALVGQNLKTDELSPHIVVPELAAWIRKVLDAKAARAPAPVRAEGTAPA